MIQRRRLLASAGFAASMLAAPAIVRAQGTTVKMGALRLVHSMPPYFYEKFAPAGTKIEIIVFDSPTDGKNAVVTKSVDFGTFGIAAGILGAAAGEPVMVVGALSNKGMGVISKAGSDMKTHQGPQGQEGRHLAGLDAGGLHPRAPARWRACRSRTSRRCACRSARCRRCWRAATSTPMSAPSRARRCRSPRAPGQLVEYPYSTPMGGLNMIFGTHADTVAKNPELVKAMLKTHRQAVEFMMANTPAVIDATVQKLGANRAAVEQALGAKNVEYVWKLDDKVQGQAKTYAQHMLELKQIRALPKFETFLNPKFSNELASSSTR